MLSSRGKIRLTKEEIMEILRRNANQYRDDEQFVQYIMDLAMYLSEYRLHVGDAAGAIRIKLMSDTGVQRRSTLSETRQRDEEMFSVLSKHSPPSEARAACRLCGAPCEGHAMCPNCGNMAV